MIATLTTLFRNRRPRGGAGFTLVESAMSIAVVAVGVVGILALFPLGLRATRSATDDTQMASIAQDYVAYYQQLALASNNYASGGLLANADYSTATTNDNLIYTVRVLVTNNGFAQMTNSSVNLLSRVIVQVSRPGSKTNTYVTETARYVKP